MPRRISSVGKAVRTGGRLGVFGIMSGWSGKNDGVASARAQAEQARTKTRRPSARAVLVTYMEANIPASPEFIKLVDIRYNLYMTDTSELKGVITAALTPLHENGSLAEGELPGLLKFLAERGSHGALLLGTTGEGPSFSPDERVRIVRAGVTVRQEHPQFKILVGTGTPSLEETVALNKAAFDLGADGVVVLPPYFFRKASEDGIYEWFSQILRRSLPSGAALLVYHIPSLTGISLSLDFFDRLLTSFPGHVIGIKDSSADKNFARQLGERFGTNLRVFNGTDSLFDLALENAAAGCITAMANLRSPDLRLIWDARQQGKVDFSVRERVILGRSIMERFPPNPPLYKALIHHLHGFPSWKVRSPLVDLTKTQIETILAHVLAEAPEFSQ